MLELIVISTLNGVLFGMLLFLLSSGLTVIFSMMGVLNFAHASFYMLGAFFGYQLTRWIGFWPALVLAPLLVGAVGMAVERYGLRNTHKHGHVAELLLTFGLAFAIEEIVSMIWGKSPVDYRVPAALDFPAFSALLHQLSRLQDLHAGGVGVDLRRAADRSEEDPGRPDRAGGADASEHGRPSRPQCRARLHAGVRRRLGARGRGRRHRRPRSGDAVRHGGLLGPILFVVIVFGGLGSLPGAFIASLVIGLVQTFAVALNGSLASAFGPLDPSLGPSVLTDIWNVTIAQIAPILPYLLLVLILIFRPMGLLGTRET